MKENRKYYIKITYDTGNSFHHEIDVVSSIKELSWNNLEIAKKNLKYINDHYRYLQDCTGYGCLNFSKKELQDKKDKAKKSPWFDGLLDWDKTSENSIFLENDEGGKVRISTFWTGYFETLGCAEIESRDNDSDMKVSFK